MAELGARWCGISSVTCFSKLTIRDSHGSRTGAGLLNLSIKTRQYAQLVGGPLVGCDLKAMPQGPGMLRSQQTIHDAQETLQVYRLWDLWRRY